MTSGDASARCSTSSPQTNAPTTSEPPAMATHCENALDATGVDLYFDQQNIDTATPAGKLLFQVTGAFAEFERSMIRQRVNAGLARARAQGKRLGRPKIAAKTEW